MKGRPADAGSALVEFTVLAVVLLVPLTYLVLAVFAVQRAAYAVTAAAREAGRAYATADTRGSADARAGAAAALALRDHGLALPPGAVALACEPAGGCLTPGSRVRVQVDVAVPLPFVPRLFGGQPPAVRVRGQHVEPVDEWRAAPG